jgi:hypothetical protein
MDNEKKDLDYYVEIKECPICLDPIDISNNIILVLDCCHKEIHLECMKKWILNPQNTQKDKCILCRVSSDLIIDISAPILYENSDISNNNTLEIFRQLSENNTISTDISDNFNTNLMINYRNIFNVHLRSRRTRIIICNFCCFAILITCILYILFITCKDTDCR